MEDDIKIKKYEVIKDGWVASNWRTKGQIINVAISRHIELENVREIKENVPRETLENKEQNNNEKIIDKVIKNSQNSNKIINKKGDKK